MQGIYIAQFAFRLIQVIVFLPAFLHRSVRCWASRINGTAMITMKEM